MIPEFVRERQKDCSKSVASLGCLGSARARYVGTSLLIPVPSKTNRKMTKFKAIFTYII